MNKVNLKVGQKLIVELDDEVILGELIHVASDNTFIKLANARDISANNLLGNQAYYSSEIRNIQIVDDAKDEPESSTEHTTVAPTPSPPVKHLSLECLNDALQRVDNCVYIQQPDAKYHAAISVLKKERTLAISMEGVEEGRHAKSVSLLSIASNSAIYIFDIKWLNITKDLRELISSDRYLRVLHNGRFIQDILLHRYNLALGRCFDTMLAHIATTKCKATKDPETAKEAPGIISIQTCIAYYLKLPENFFNDNVNYDLRPTSTEAKREAAKKIAFLISLQDHFIHEIMLERFYRGCAQYCTSLACNVDFIDSLAEANSDGHRAVNAVKPFELDAGMHCLWPTSKGN
ncbi:protein Exd1 homolog [Anopheles aquasalis]|uniref:protein Exd1 homolog n=1 Tax=Anopheles aquasalis TaxID=42839 RepID=UPI00215B4C8D|nr:protein Exd1 homolog [Anopheles aquasalis]